MAIAAGSACRSRQPPPNYPPDLPFMRDLFQRRTAECLALSNYTKPGSYKIEALMLHMWVELFRTPDTQAGLIFILATTIKLAFRMGYQRDPKFFPEISAMEGEMRRRIWAHLYQMDTILSFQAGSPRSIQDWQYDTELPRNLSDENFDENTERLPPSLPDSQPTTVSYLRAKMRLVEAFGPISDTAFSRKETVSYGKIIGLDKSLEEAHELIPTFLKVRPLELSIGDPITTIVKRFTLETCYQKSRCVLHRRYVGGMHPSQQYLYSRLTCIGAAMEILRQHAVVYNEVQPGGRLYGDISLTHSLHNGDFLLAAMIICLSLASSREEGNSPQKNGILVEDRTAFLLTLEKTHEIFKDLGRQSADAQKACDALGLMLRKVNGEQHVPQVSSKVYSNGADTVSPSTISVINGMTARFFAPCTLLHLQVRH